MSSDPTALRHNALVYESTDEYLARAVPFLKAGIETGEGAVVAHTKPGLAMMREACRRVTRAFGVSHGSRANAGKPSRTNIAASDTRRTPRPSLH